MSTFREGRQVKSIINVSRQSLIFGISNRGFFYYNPTNDLLEGKRERMVAWGNIPEYRPTGRCSERFTDVKLQVSLEFIEKWLINLTR